MSHLFSRLMSTASAGYAAYALAQPSHLGSAMEVEESQRPGYDAMAQVFGVRDLGISALGMFGRDARTVRTAMKLRITMDLGDAAVLSTRTESPEIRKKLLFITTGWAALNLLALALDSRG